MHKTADVVVIGAGMVGVCTALALRDGGLDVVLVDRKKPGRETSYGNAGVIQREGIHPYLFPRNLGKLLRYAFNRQPDARYQLSSLPAIAPFLWRYFLASAAGPARRTTDANIALFEGCLEAHEALFTRADAGALIRKSGWIKVSRSASHLAGYRNQVNELRALGLRVDVITPDQLSELEPHLDVSGLAGAIHYRDPWTCADPGALVAAYAGLFSAQGGDIVEAEVVGAVRHNDRWHVQTDGGDITAPRVVLAAGPWAKKLLDALGLVLPMGVKRGYHRHYKMAGNAILTRPVCDDDNGFVMAPMNGGLRVTSGVEFATLDAPPRLGQLDQISALASGFLPFDGRADEKDWRGARPVFPDLLPVMGQAPGLDGLWLNIGHGHQGFTLGPVAGGLVAAMIKGATPPFDPTPYSAGRFLR